MGRGCQRDGLETLPNKPLQLTDDPAAEKLE
jgi:hypothetical protein